MLPASVYIKIFLATFLWGTAFPVAKSALEFIGPLTLAGYRFSLAGIILLISSLFIGKTPALANLSLEKNQKSGTNWPHIFLTGICGTAIFYGLFFTGVRLTSASSAAAMDAAGPIITAFMGHVFLYQDKLTPRKILALLISLSGILLIAFVRPLGKNSIVSPTGCMLILTGLCFGSIGSILVIRYRGSLSLMKLTGFQMLIGGTALLICAFFKEGIPVLTKSQLLNFAPKIVWLALVSSIAFRLWYGVVRRYKVSSLSIFSFLTGLWGVILSITFLNEPVTWPLFVGLGLVIFGVLLMVTIKGSHLRSGQKPRDD